MVRIAASSDNHLDINRVDVDQVIQAEAQALTELHIDYYLIVGDVSNRFNRTLNYVDQLQAALPATQVFFVAGNHDMSHDISENELETLKHPNYLHNQYVDLPNMDWRIIGLNGWYDYGFAPDLPESEAAGFHFGRFYDRIIDQNESDLQRYQRAYEQLTQQLTAGATAHKRMIVMTHFVPISDDLLPNTAKPRELVNAMLGSPRTGMVLEQVPGVRHVVFGHAHVTAPMRQHGLVQYDNVSLGVRRRNDWPEATFMSSWKKRLKILEVNA
ncbi:phosphatidylinositol kinase [Weissella viridescens]|uniref:Phosphatidylinositol kinase n=1 Tax=Weissella viridescens TaxID=1629 RepID=A0A3P2RCM9_WEIVI|nr:metallophosphoesterase [Weissella viridescens]RRG18499.1 phosphatidylinositol kinase [Weissella viridescens]